MLSFLWIWSIVLSGMSLLIMVILILRRVMLQRRQANDADARQRLLKALIAYSDDKDAGKLKEVIVCMRPRIAIDAGFEFLGLLRGDEHEQITSIFMQCGLPARISSQLKRGNEAARIHAAEMLSAFPAMHGVAGLTSAL